MVLSNTNKSNRESSFLHNRFIASGILFLPNAFKNGGILFAPLVMILIAALCLHSFLLLVKCRELHPGSYGEIGERYYGQWMRYIVLFAIAISQFGFCWQVPRNCSVGHSGILQPY